MEEHTNDPRMERVIRYVEGDMDAGERVAFEAELANDPALGADLAVAKKTIAGLHALGEDALRRELRDAEAELDSVDPPGRSRRWWWAAAAAVILIGSGTWWLLANETPQYLAKEYALIEPGLPVLMSTEGGTLDAIMNAYKQDELTTAHTLLTEALRSEPYNDTLVYFMGIVEDRQGNDEVANDLFERVPATSVFAARAHYSAAIIALRSGDVELARTELDHVGSSADVQLSAKSRELLARLDRL
jgi:hypothetical protein